MKSNKNDRNDAEGICEAVSRPSMRFVPIKSAAQQYLQLLHRVRSQLIRSLTALANEIRGLLGEYGIAIAKELAVLRRALPLILEDQDNGLSGVFRETLAEMMERLKFLEEHIRQYERRVKQVFEQDERCQRLAQIQDVGPLIATALVAAVGNAGVQRRARTQCLAWPGPTPAVQRRPQHPLGHHQAWRSLPAHAADPRSTCGSTLRRTPDRSRRSVDKQTQARRGPNVAAVAVANKNARVAWKLLSTGPSYRPPQPLPAANNETRRTRAPLGR